MEAQRFRRQVADLAHACRIRPQAFIRQTAWQMAAVQIAIAVLLALGLAALLWLSLGWPAGRLPWLRWPLWLLAAWWLLSVGALIGLRLPAPAGRPLSRAEAPALFELIERLRARFGAPPITELLVDDSLGATVVQRPRLGLLGVYRNTLVLGLPLLMALDGRQLAAVLSRQLAHLRSGPGQRAAWVHRTRRNWILLGRTREAPGRRLRFGPWLGEGGLELFFHQVWPRLQARALVVARHQEIEADRQAQAALGQATVAHSLLSLALQAQFLRLSFWPEVWAGADRQAEPEATPLRELRLRLKDSLAQAEARRWLELALKALPDPEDSLPGLRERLVQAEFEPALPPAPAASVAELWLGTTLPVLIQALDEAWQIAQAGPWRARYQRHRQRERLLTELAEEDSHQPLSPADRLLWGRTAGQVQGAAAAIEIFRGALGPGAYPPAEARYLLASALLETCLPLLPRSRQPEPPPALGEAIAWLQGLAAETSSSANYQQAQTADPQWRLPAAQALERLYEQREDHEALKPLRLRLRQLAEEARLARAELRDFDGSPPVLAAARVSARLLRPTLALLQDEPAVGRAWLICKTSPLARGWQLHLLVIERSGALGQPDSARWAAALKERIELPMDLEIIDLAAPAWRHIARRDLAQQLQQIGGSAFYTAASALQPRRS